MSEDFEIVVLNRDQRFRCKPGKSLLSGMEYQQSKAIEVGCRGGGCGICRIKILSGEFEGKKMSIKHVTQDQAEEGMALSCRVFPQSDMVIESDHFQTTINKQNNERIVT
ncbi:MAG TPA: 2Fe-2S iron-sulfur cluster binding domain-containing protein [Pseudomonadales bacterium]|jgi:ferredoxin|nr:2Fe-2S iron-sulfur cluster binding domain-containing protein [Pseudomonadales bacterium]